MSSAKKLEANRKNAKKSTGPTTRTGKRNVRFNALKHGFYAAEMIILPEHKTEIEALRKTLHAQLLPKTALQVIAFKGVVYCAWQCELGARLDMRRLNAALFLSPDEQESPPDPKQRIIMDSWFVASPEDLRRGRRFLDDLQLEVERHREVPEGMKESVLKGFGSRFLDLLDQPKSPISLSALQLAHHLVVHAETYKMPLPPIYEKEPKVIVDPQQSLRATLNLIELMKDFLDDLRQLSRQRGQDVARITASDSPPRHFADAARALRRAVEWYQYLVANSL